MRNIEKDSRYEKIMSLYNEGILDDYSKDHALKELSYIVEDSEVDDPYEDEYLIYCDEIPADLNYEQRAEWVMDRAFEGYHFC